jgi:hypothetical protein
VTSASLLTRVRVGAVVGGLAAALALTGCSSSDNGDKGAGDTKSSTSASPSESSDASGGSGGSGRQGGLDGSWVATTGGKSVALVIANGKAGLFDSGGDTCSGISGGQAGMQMIHLTCTKGGDDRSEGMVKSVSDTTLKVSWKGFGNETYTKSKDGKLPEGLPTPGLPSS